VSCEEKKRKQRKEFDSISAGRAVEENPPGQNGASKENLRKKKGTGGENLRSEKREYRLPLIFRERALGGGGNNRGEEAKYLLMTREDDIVQHRSELEEKVAPWRGMEKKANVGSVGGRTRRKA